jgi:hypothetical protein
MGGFPGEKDSSGWLRDGYEEWKKLEVGIRARNPRSLIG